MDVMMGTDKSPNVIEMRSITKSFPGVLANNDVDFAVRAGEIHALLGENGAGKSTLMSILTGLYRPDRGVIKVDGKPVDFQSPRDAIQHGIGMVHQHFMLVPRQSVTENILLGLAEPRFYLNLPKYEKVIRELGEQYSLHVDPQAKIWQLSVGEQQRVEILKVLYRGARVLILDEPTAVLAPQEIEELFRTLRSMASLGKSIVFISHKLREVLEIADRITVLQKGEVTSSGVETSATNMDDLAYSMVGRKVLFHIEKKHQKPGDVVLSVKCLHAENDKGLPALRGIDLTVREGEIVGLAGVAGNGQSELAQVITGLRPATAGSVYIQRKELITACRGGKAGVVRQLVDSAVSHIPEDRTHDGTAPNLSVADNIIMKDYWKAPIAKGWVIDRGATRARALSLREKYEIQAPSIDTPVRLLSGGNLQRLILAREISTNPKLLIAVQPTRGLDVGAIEGIQRALLDQREAGTAILLISEELEELIMLCDRIAVIHGGEIMGVVHEPDVNLIGLMMTGTPLASLQAE
jgi:ABC-type uncharacterized transport system ATPase subunit